MCTLKSDELFLAEFYPDIIVNDILFSEDGLLLGVADDHSITLYDATSGTFKRTIPVQNCTKFMWLEDHLLCAIGGNEGNQAFIINGEDGTYISEFHIEKPLESTHNSCYTMSYHPLAQHKILITHATPYIVASELSYEKEKTITWNPTLAFRSDTFQQAISAPWLDLCSSSFAETSAVPAFAQGYGGHGAGVMAGKSVDKSSSSSSSSQAPTPDHSTNTLRHPFLNSIGTLKELKELYSPEYIKLIYTREQLEHHYTHEQVASLYETQSSTSSCKEEGKEEMPPAKK